MRPPICAICNKHLEENEGALIYFKERPSDIAWKTRMKEKQMIGHPPNAEWFCGNHCGKARELKHLTIDDAMSQLKK